MEGDASLPGGETDVAGVDGGESEEMSGMLVNDEAEGDGVESEASVASSPAWYCTFAKMASGEESIESAMEMQSLVLSMI